MFAARSLHEYQIPMSNLSMIGLVLCVSVGAAQADELKPHSALKGHPNLINAEKELFNAFEAISRSQKANECVWGLEGGHGQAAKVDIEAARKQAYEAAEWVSSHEKDCLAFKPKVGVKGEPRLKGHAALKGHGNLIAAETNLIDAWVHITKSQEANECVFGLEGGHGAGAKGAIDKAFHQVYDAAEWVNTHGSVCHK
jgi:hypothetical protein